MKIDPSAAATPTNLVSLPGRPQDDSSTESSGPAAASVTTGASASGAGSTVSLSALSTNLLSLGSANSDDIDLTRVNAIRTALANGTLQVNPGRIADGMLRNASDLLKRA